MNVSPAESSSIALPKADLSISTSGSRALPVSAELANQADTVVSPTSTDPVALAKHLEQAVSAINAFLKPISNNLEFSVDDDSGKTVVKLMDRETNTVLRQYPTKEALAISKEIDRFQGLLINTEA
jgi:flagellar protein FlaG